MGGGQTQTVEDAAARILARAYGPGEGWAPDYDHVKASDWRPRGNATAVTGDLRVSRETETAELAGRAVHWKRSKQADWLQDLPDNKRAEVESWSAANPISGKGAKRPREYQHWETGERALLPYLFGGATAAAALAMAKLRGPLLPALELFALQQGKHVETLGSYLICSGARREVAEAALLRWLYPSRGVRKPSTAEGARACHMRKADFCAAVREAVTRLETWTHDAAVQFLEQYRALRA